MALSDRLAIIITANGSQAVGEFNRVGRAAGQQLGRAEAGSQRLGTQLTRAGAAMVTFGAVALVGLYQLAQAAEEQTRAELMLQNTIGAMPELAGASTDAFLAQADALMAVTVADDAAIVSMQAMLGTFHLTASEIETATPLVLDYARKFGVDLTTAAKQVGKALQGNIGTLQRNGIAIDENAYATDRFGAVMDALRENAGGFAEAEGATFSGRLEIMKNQLGEVAEGVGVGVVDAFSSMLGAVDSATDAFSSLDAESQSTVGRLLTFGAVGLTASGGISLVAGAAMRFAGQAKSAADAAYLMYLRVRTSDVTFRQAAVGAGVAAGALALLVVAWQRHQSEQASAQAQSEALVAAFSGEGDAAAKLSAALDGLEEASDTASGAELRLALVASGETMDSFAEAINAGGSTLDDFIAKLAETGEVSSDTRGFWEQAAEEIGSSGSFEDAATETDRVRSALEQLQEAMSTADTAEAAEGIDRIGGAASITTEQLDELTSALEEFFGATFGVERATDDVVEAQEALFQSLVENGPVLDGQSAQARANRDAFDGWSVSIGEAATAILEQGGSAAEAAAYIDQQRAALLGARDAGLISSATFQHYSGILDGIRSEVSTSVMTPGAAAAATILRNVRDLANDIPREVRIALIATGVNTAITQLNNALVAAGHAPRWSGGPIEGTGPKMAMLHGGEYVLSADQVDRIKRGRQSRGARGDGGTSGSGGVVVNVYGDTYGVDNLTEKVMAGIRKAERRVAA